MKRGRPMRRTALKRTPFKQTERKAMKKTAIKRSRIKRRSANRQAAIDADDGKFHSEVARRCKYVCRACIAAKRGKFVTDKPHEQLYMQNMRMEIHHIDGRLGDLLHDADRSVMLCQWHHHYSKFSPHGGPKLWREVLKPILEEELSHGD